MNLCRTILYMLEGKERRRGNPSWVTALGLAEAASIGPDAANALQNVIFCTYTKQFASHTIAGAARVRIS